MTLKDFLEQPPISIIMMGKSIDLVPTVSATGACYKSPPIEFFLDGPDGKFRVRGQFTLRCPYSKHWPEKS